MTIDDDNSVYVGGLPYDATEESIRRVFSFYGTVIAVKIINDRGVGGKCYGFVTFTNPRAALDAIEDMDGKAIDGRVVKVNNVRTRDRRSNYGCESLRHNSGRGMDWERSRDRERDYEHDRNWNRDRPREQSGDCNEDRHRGYELPRDYERKRDHIIGKDRYHAQDRGLVEFVQKHDGNRGLERERDQNLDQDRDKEMQRSGNQHRDENTNEDQMSQLLNGSSFKDHRHRELSSDLSEEDHNHDSVRKQLEISNKKFEDIRKEISEMEDLIQEKRQYVTKLHEKSQILEDSLTAAKKFTSLRQMQLTSLHKGFFHVKEYRERLESSEQELQSLVDSAVADVDFGDAGMRDGLANGSVGHTSEGLQFS